MSLICVLGNKAAGDIGCCPRVDLIPSEMAWYYLLIHTAGIYYFVMKLHFDTLAHTSAAKKFG